MRRSRRAAPIFGRRRRSRAARLLLATIVLVAAILGALTIAYVVTDDESSSGDPGPVHVHALGLNPPGDSLFIATHTGLYRLDPGSDVAERVGDNLQDTMGFSVVGRDQFIGSGHPDLRDELPPLLGLIESQDAGEAWTSVSLLGEADFHVLRVRGRRVVGYDATRGRVLISDDGGTSWGRSRRPPEPLLDLVLDPTSPDALLAAGESRLLASPDGGRTWKEREEGTGLLAWPRHNRLYLLDGNGRMWLSPDGGRRWQARGEIGGRPAALLAVRPGTLYAATHEGAIKHSIDGGASWTTRSTPSRAD